jgi:CO/xanthine dehydrogenase Mo-binding subunit
MHASIGPSSALAEWDDDGLTVWTSSQAVHLVRPALAEALDVELASVRAVHVRGPGCYGHNGSDDAAFEAALLARAVPGRPVLLKWTRADEHGGEPYAPPAVVVVRGSLDADGQIMAMNLDAWGTTHNARPFAFGAKTGFVSAWRLDPPVPREIPGPLLLPEAGIHRNLTPAYAIPSTRIVKHFVRAAPLRTSSTRSLGAYVNVFAIEAVIDELAAEAGQDPLEFRLAHLPDERARAVLKAAAERAGWGTRTASFGRGLGIGFSRYKNSAAYAAVIVEVTVDDETAQIAVERATIAADAGQVVDPSGLANQLEGGLVQSVSWTLYEEVGFDRTRVKTTDWDTYPILRFGQVPDVETVLVDRPGAPYLGAGEATQGPTAAAIGNAVRAAIGVRMTDLPLTPERVREAVARA